MPIYDFRCSDGHTTEAIRPMSTEAIPCACGGEAHRTGVNPGIGIVGPTTDTRGMYRRFTEASAELDYSAQRYEQSTGQQAPNTGLWSAAKAQATAMTRAGEAPAVRLET